MKKFKKFSSFVFALLAVPTFINVNALGETPDSEAILLIDSAAMQKNYPIFLWKLLKK